MNAPANPLAIAAQLRALPPLPLVANKLIAKMTEAEPSAVDIARLIASDDALTARLLRLVNSPFFGLQRQIASVQEALHVVGLNAVQRLVVSAAVMQPFTAIFQNPQRAQQFWRHRLRCGLTARHLARDGAADLAFVAGLLHEIGELGMLVHFGTLYETRCFEQRQMRGAARVQAERAEFGFDHAQLGAAILSNWSLPPPVVEAVGRHHDASAPSGPPLVAAVWAASEICEALDNGAAEDEALDPLGRLGPADYARIGRELQSMEALVQ